MALVTLDKMCSETKKTVVFHLKPDHFPSHGCHGYGIPKEHGLQIVTLAAKAQVDLGVQARAARLALRCFRAEPRLVPRALLALSASGSGRASPRKTGGLLGTIMEYTGDSLSKMVHGGL